MSKQIVSALDAWRDSQEALERGDVPRRLRLAGAAGRGRHRSAVRRRRASREMDPRTASVLQARDRRAEIADRHGRAARRPDPRRCSMSAWRAAWWTSAASRRSAGFARPTSGTRLTLARVQGAGARAVLHAADRPRRRARGDPRLLPDEHRRAPRGLRGAPARCCRASGDIAGEAAKRLQQVARALRRRAAGMPEVDAGRRPFDPKARAS